MNSRALWLSAILVTTCALSDAQAAEKANKVGSFGIGLSTNGIGVDYAYGLNKYFDIRGGYDFGTLSLNGEEEGGIEYGIKLKFASGRLLLDYKPFGGGFHISGGVYTGGPDLDLNASGEEEEIELGDRVYNADIDLLGGVDFGGTAPYFGIGWGGTTNGRGFGFSTNLGVIITGAPKVTLAVPDGFACDFEENEECDPVEDGFNVNDGSVEAAAFRAAVEAERLDLEDDAGKLKFYPIFRSMIHYRF